MGLAFRHLLLIRLCLRDMCHLIDLLYYCGRSSFRVFSHILLFLATVIFMCIWIGITLYITDSSSTDRHAILTPSRYIYFVYHILLNVGYGDTAEQSMLSFIIIIIMTLIACPLLIIIYQNLIQELNLIRRMMTHVETLHRLSFINYLTTHINKYHQSTVNYLATIARRFISSSSEIYVGFCSCLFSFVCVVVFIALRATCAADCGRALGVSYSKYRVRSSRCRFTIKLRCCSRNFFLDCIAAAVSSSSDDVVRTVNSHSFSRLFALDTSLFLTKR
ncbi:unnamed protein product [Rotaria magnacalcarata]|nr:unnamed protein product [Rotaria magnacalcarata]CAF1216041.1 unnamed protein product [Rotaria magnacalcarata]CAF2125051.1 unnamed protein product [Rotaria magnacalcarata]CAF2138500.1 unnamed protein product [Rotaria magnacalcarata]CAF4047252.1 unnamed protein product [Rotaria magnacalcarata]